MLESFELWVITGFYFWTFLNQFSFASYKVLKNHYSSQKKWLRFHILTCIFKSGHFWWNLIRQFPTEIFRNLKNLKRNFCPDVTQNNVTHYGLFLIYAFVWALSVVESALESFTIATFSRRKGPLRGGIILQNNCHFEVDQSAWQIAR